MAMDMKKNIAGAARTLLVDKKVKKLTVKDIVEECQITRQTFYYHFEDIPGLLHWILEQEMEQIMREARSEQDPEAALRYFFQMAVQAAPYIKKTIASNYGDEFKELLKQQLYRMFSQAVEEDGLYRSRTQAEVKLILRYHCQAVMGILGEWSEEDTRNLDFIVHEVYLLMTGGVSSD